jgi:hypothetical protein
MTMTVLRALRQMRHIDLLAAAIEAGVTVNLNLDTGSRSRDQLVDALTRAGPMARLAERAETRLTP